MKIALVHDFLFKLGGAERVLKTFADLFPNAPIFTLLYDEERCGAVFPKSQVQTSKLQRYPSFIRRHPQWLFSKMPEAIERFDFLSYDLVISSSGAFSHGIITGPLTKHICYCHSPMRYGWDYTHRYVQEKWLPWWCKFLIERELHTVRIWDLVASDRPDFYIANSKHTAKRLKKYYRVDAPVIYPPVDIDRFNVSSEKEDFFLIVSALSPFKKIDLAIHACNTLGKQLVIIGDGNQRSFLQKISGPTITFIGKRSDNETAAMMAKCRALIFPGEEDFGITPIEAMACGKPVIAYGKGGVTETVIPQKTGLFFPELTTESLVTALFQFDQQESSFVPASIRQQAEQFRPEIFRSKFLSFIHDVCPSS